MVRWSVLLAVITLAVASCTVNHERKAASPSATREEPAKTADVSVTPPGPLDDDWSRWLIGQWDCSAESDIPGFKAWVRGRGQMTAEMGLGGQFLLIRMEGRMTRISDEYLRYMREDQHVPEEQIAALQHLRFSNLELRSIDPRTGRIVAYLFDSWRCVAEGSGRREGNREIMEWKWSLAGGGTSVRVTEKVSDEKIVMTEKYSLVDGSTMEDRAVMMRKRSVPADSEELAFLTGK